MKIDERFDEKNRKKETLKCIIDFPKCPRCEQDVDDYSTGDTIGYCTQCDTEYNVEVIYK